MEILSVETAESVARELLRSAVALGSAINSIEQLAKANADSIRQEPVAYETAVLVGQDVIQALKTLAMRLDRAALAKLEVF